MRSILFVAEDDLIKRIQLAKISLDMKTYNEILPLLINKGLLELEKEIEQVHEEDVRQ